MILSAVTKCSSCGHVYELENVNVLGHQDDLWFLMVSCEKCHTQGLIAAVVKDGSEAGEDIDGEDLPVAEILELPENRGLVTADDVLDMHLFLDNFSGDFRELFDE
jgi:hypothetical protein